MEHGFHQQVRYRQGGKTLLVCESAYAQALEFAFSHSARRAIGEAISQASDDSTARSDTLGVIYYENAIVRASVKFSDDLACVFDLELRINGWDFDDDPASPGGAVAVTFRKLGNAVSKAHMVVSCSYPAAFPGRPLRLRSHLGGHSVGAAETARSCASLEMLRINDVGGSMMDGNHRRISIEKLIFIDRVIDLTQNKPTIAFYNIASTNEDVGTYSDPSLLADDCDRVRYSLTALSGIFHGVYGMLMLNADGTYVYTPYASAQPAARGEDAGDVFTNKFDGSLGDAGTLTLDFARRTDAAVAGPVAVIGHAIALVAVEVIASNTDVDNGTVLTVPIPGSTAGKDTASAAGSQVQRNPGAVLGYLDGGESADLILRTVEQDEGRVLASYGLLAGHPSGSVHPISLAALRARARRLVERLCEFVIPGRQRAYPAYTRTAFVNGLPAQA